VAGKGTRFLPATKASPKEMLPVVDKPLIQYAVEEAIEAGATNLVFITGRTSAPSRTISTWIRSSSCCSPARTRKRCGTWCATSCRHVNCIYVRQGEPLGLGHAVLCARPVVGEQPFFVHLADDLIDADEACLARWHGCSRRAAAACSAWRRCRRPDPPVRHHRRRTAKAGLRRLRGIVEKPQPADAPSNLAVVGRYILTPRIFELLEETRAGAGGEIQLTDAIARLLLEEPVYGYRVRGPRFDCGSKLGYLEATVHYGLKHPELGDDFRAHLKTLKL
jgi:UTP--glucose-1-phosphate uridylyltransferase